MSASPYPGGLRARLAGGLPPERGVGRRWRLTGDALEAMADAPASRDVIAVPTEHVLLLTVDLPLPTRRQRIEALPFAIEDRIADPLAAVHLVLGAEISPKRFLVAVVRHDVLRGWLSTIDGVGLDRAALVPDALLLPPPGPGCWTVRVEQDRAVVRSDDDTGFAVPAALLIGAWEAAGRPPCVVEGGTPPEGMSGNLTGAPDFSPTSRPIPIDLRQGRYAARRAPLSGIARRVLVIAAAGVAAHGLILAVDTIALQSIAARKADATRALAVAAIPSIGPTDDFVGIAAGRLTNTVGTGRPDRFLPLLARISAALGSAGSLELRGLSFDAAREAVALDIPVGSEQRLTAALVAAGLSVKAGAGRLVVAGHG